jgi:glyoxylase-like metal-dependent hydrolase (beta-lactamase superfamily II)/8-oxo-dGTP pyrophosphatase MutT (NUDIX family)
VLAAGPGSTQLLVVRRSERLRFFGGYYAFPGGKVDATDAEKESSGKPDDARVRRIAAVRELFEETGVLLARRADGSFPAAGPELDELRRGLMEERLRFAEILGKLGVTVRDEDLIPLGEVTTPEFVPVRFGTLFFLGFLPAGQRVDIWPGELDQGIWTKPGDILEAWQRGDCLIAPPTVMMLETLRGRPIEEAPALLGPIYQSLAGGAIHPIYFAPDVRMIPLRTESLPPTNFTNAYFVGRGPLYLIDPGTTEREEQSRLFEVLDASRNGERRLAAVILTHQHPDHVGAANACAERYKVPIWAHRLTAEALQGKIAIDRHLDEGDRLALGKTADGRPWELQVLHTPGHAAGHLCFFEPRLRLLFTGDMVSTLSSVVIGPPDGDLAAYLESLRRLRSLPTRLLFPGHGNASSRPQEVIDEYLAHRAKREEMLLLALSEKPRTIEDLLPELYKGTPPNLMRFAEMQLSAGLQKLEREGRAASAEENGKVGWRLVRPRS